VRRQYKSNDQYNVAACLTCKNAGATLGCTLQSIASLDYPRDRLAVIIVDGGSEDDSVDIARKLLNFYGLKGEIVVKPCNIPEGRNICISKALETNADYIFFIDSDVVIADKGILAKLTEFDMRYGPCVVSANTKFKFFSSLEELRLFCSRAAELGGDSGMMLAGAVPWSGMSLTLIPRCIAEQVRFDEDLTFAEDAYYGYLVWRGGYKVYGVNADKPIAYDVNLPKHTDIYIRMGVREYLRGLYKKALIIVYTYYGGGVLKTMIRLLRNIRGRRMLFHFLSMLILAIGLVMLFTASLQLWGLAFTILHMVADLSYLMRLWKVKCRNIHQALASLLKYRIYSLYALLSMPIITLKHREQLNKLHRAIRDEAELYWMR